MKSADGVRADEDKFLILRLCDAGKQRYGSLLRCSPSVPRDYRPYDAETTSFVVHIAGVTIASRFCAHGGVRESA
jgi:hypothetical protein